MDHVVVPLDDDHVRALQHLRRRIDRWCRGDARRDGHITLAAFTGLDRVVAAEALRAAAGSIRRCVARAHGYGLFIGDAGDISVHLPVVRDDALNALHRAVVSALRDVGASIAGWVEPAVWTPHVTIASRSMTVADLASVVAALADRPHPSWHVPVRTLQLVGGRRDGAVVVESVALRS